MIGRWKLMIVSYVRPASDTRRRRLSMGVDSTSMARSWSVMLYCDCCHCADVSMTIDSSVNRMSTQDPQS